MNTTTLFAELLVIGLHSIVWLSIIVIAFVGYEKINIKELFSLHFALPLLGLAYVLAIIIDRIADLVLIIKDNELRKKTLVGEHPELLEMRYAILSKSKETFDQLQYIRHRLRIARASIFNFTATGLSAILLVCIQPNSQVTTKNKIVLSITILIMTSVIVWLCYKAWISLNKAYISSTSMAYSVLHESTKEKGYAANSEIESRGGNDN